MPEHLDTADGISYLLQRIDSDTGVCTGNGDAQFLALAESKGGKFYNQTSKHT